ncbi:MAG TPA: hypothetical protein EYN79_10805, partial [Planctomycetes bacterium]|nr:hypothetical protein [Planctomycetota bacterium]
YSVQEVINEAQILSGVTIPVVEEPRGDGGFGYDPVFLPASSNLTFAEMSGDHKDSISHRGIALARLQDDLARGRLDLELLEDQR